MVGLPQFSPCYPHGVSICFLCCCSSDLPCFGACSSSIWLKIGNYHSSYDVNLSSVISTVFFLPATLFDFYFYLKKDVLKAYGDLQGFVETSEMCLTHEKCLDGPTLVTSLSTCTVPPTEHLCMFKHLVSVMLCDNLNFSESSFRFLVL